MGAIKILQDHRFLFLALAVLGTVVRALFCSHIQIWNQAYDQLVWQLSVDELAKTGNVVFKQLIHYPFEGGTVLFSLLSLALSRLTWPVPTLSVVALLADFVVRLFQMLIVYRCFGKRTGLLFGIWTVMSVPLLLSFGLAFFGLHAVNAIFPFIIMVVMYHFDGKKNLLFALGATSAIAVYFSYDNLLLIPAVLFWLVLKKDLRPRFPSMGIYLFWLLIFLIPHLLIRLLVDLGFPGEPMAGLLKREKGWQDLQIFDSLVNFLHFFNRSLPSGIFLHQGSKLTAMVLGVVLLGYFFVSAVCFFRRQRKPAYADFPLIVFLTFAVAYSFSIFYTDRTEQLNFYLYRHLSYVAPLLFLFIFLEFKMGRRNAAGLTAPLVLVCIFESCDFMWEYKPIAPPSYKVIGWIVAQKYLDQPRTLQSMTSLMDLVQARDFYFGTGWGTAAVLLKNAQFPDHTPIDQIREFHFFYDTLARRYLREGYLYAFSPGVTPTLDDRYEPVLGAIK